MTELPLDRAHLHRIASNIERYGLHLEGVVGTRSGATWTYTVGLLPVAGAEAMVIGLDPERAGHALNALHDLLLEGDPVPVGRSRPLVLDRARFALVRAEPGRVRRRTHWSPAAIAYWGTQGRSAQSVRLIQLVWSDIAGRLPWEPGFDRFLRRLQPLLDAPPPRLRRPNSSGRRRPAA